MNSIVIHIASGHAWFTGVAIIIVAAYVRHRCKVHWQRTLIRLFTVTGLLLCGLSSVSIPTTCWVFAIGGTLLPAGRNHNRSRILMTVAMCIWIGITVREILWHQTPQLSVSAAAERLPVVILADSLTAGIGENEAVTWPQLLQSRRDITVIDLSHVGETVASAHKRLLQHPIPDAATVLVELGGNDILGTTSRMQFSKDLDSLLNDVCTRQRSVFVFELPLPPFHSGWAQAQRSVTSQHGAALIPRCQMASVLAGQTSTLDSVHLSQEGHERMLKVAEYVLRLPN